MKKMTLIIIMLFSALPVFSLETDFVSKYMDAYSSGNQSKEFDLLKNYAVSNPEKPESAVYAQMAASYYNIEGYDSVMDALENYRSSLSSADFSEKQEALFSLALTSRNIEENFIQRRNTYAFNSINSWKVSKNYIRYGYTDLNVDFGPERSDQYESRIISSRNNDYIRLGENVFPETGIYYFKSSFSAAEEMYLTVECSDFYKIYINGKEAGTNFYQGIYRNRRMFHVKGDGKYTVIMKIFTDRSSKFRISLTDGNFLALPPVYSEQNYSSGAVSEEHMLYPYNQLRQEGQSQSTFALSRYFYFLGSSEFIGYHELLEKERPSAGYKTLFASDLLDFHSESSAKSVLGWKMMSSIWQNKKIPVPALFYRFQQKLDEGNVLEALDIADEVRKQTFYYPLELGVLNVFFKKGYDRQFKEQYARIKKQFPDSTAPDVYKMDFYHERNNDISVQTGKALLAKVVNRNVLGNMIFHYKSKGMYDEALKCLDGKIFSPYEESMERGKILILMKNHDAAKKIFLELLSRNETPEVLFYLGKIELAEQRNADLYWGKLNSLEPEFDFPQDYLSYVTENGMKSVFDPYRNSEYVKAEIDKFTTNILYFPPAVVYRGYFFRLFRNNLSRYYHEELLYIKNDSEVSSKGEYLIPVREGYNIIKAEVIGRDGAVASSYRKNVTGDGIYLSINGIRKNCLVHVVYEIGNYDFTWYKSSFFASNYVRLLGYMENAGKIEVKVITELDNVLLYNNSRVDVKTEKEGSLNIYSMEMNRVSEPDNEYYSGDPRRNLPSFGFTNVVSADDFMGWYRGFFPQFKKPLKIEGLKIDGGMTERQKITAIYDYVSRKISTEGDLYYQPSDPEDVVFLRKGSVEDKVFLMRQILHENGIESFPALVRDENLNISGIYLKDSFTGILLYVPSAGMWLDFSSEYYPAGNVRDFYEGGDALVIKNGSTEKIPVINGGAAVTKVSATIDLKGAEESNYNMTTSYSGSSNYLRYYFKDERLHGTMVSALVSGANSSMITDYFAVSRLNDFSEPFTVTSSGVILGFALKSADSISFNPFLVKTGFVNYLYDNTRNFDLVITENEISEERYVYLLDEAFRRDEINISKKLTFGKSSVVYSVKKDKNSIVLEVEKKTDFRKQVIKSAEYSKFVSFALSVREMDNYRVLLKGGD